MRKEENGKKVEKAPKLEEVSRVTTTLLLIVLISLPIAAFQVPSISGHEDAHVHPYIAAEAFELLPIGSDIGIEIDHWLENIEYGAYDEDHTDHVYEDLTHGLYGIVSIPHYWDADEGPNDRVKNVFGQEDRYPNAYMKSVKLFNESLEKYKAGYYGDAYELLGHVVHLIGDMGVPTHVHEDFHVAVPLGGGSADLMWGGDDCFEKWMADEGYTNWNDASARYAGDLIEFPLDYKISMRHRGNWTAGLYYLMYTTNQYADYFASDDVNGDTYDPEGLMDYSGWSGPTKKSDLENNDYHWDYSLVIFGVPPFPVDDNNNKDGELGQIANKSYVYSIRAIATLYKMFYELTHAPEGTIGIAFADVDADKNADYKWVSLDLTYDVGAPEYVWDLQCNFANENEGLSNYDSDWEAVRGRKSWILSEGNGVKTVYYQLRNLMGTKSPVYSASVELAQSSIPKDFHYNFTAKGYQQPVSAVLTVYMHKIILKTHDTDGADPNVEFYYRAFIDTDEGRKWEQRYPSDGYYDIEPYGTKVLDELIYCVEVYPGQPIMLRTHGRDDDSPGFEDDWENPIADDKLGGVHTDWYEVPAKPGYWPLVSYQTFNLKDDGSVNENYEIEVSIAVDITATDWTGFEKPMPNEAAIGYGEPEKYIADSSLTDPIDQNPPYPHTTYDWDAIIDNPAIAYRMSGRSLYVSTEHEQPDMIVVGLSPLDLMLTDPDGNKIGIQEVEIMPSIHFWRITNDIPGGSVFRIDLDGDKDLDTLIVFDSRKVGTYSIQVSPSIGASLGEKASVAITTSFRNDALFKPLDPFDTPAPRSAFLIHDTGMWEIPAGPLAIESTNQGANLPPTARANGPYAAVEGTAMDLDASGSTDPDGNLLTYRWDFENDGAWDTDWSNNPTASHMWTDDWTGTVKVEVNDTQSTDTATATVTVSNAPPIVNVGPDQLASPSQEVQFVGSFTDPGAADTHTITWDFGDGITATDTLTPTHVYSEAKIFTVTLKVTDDDGDFGSVSLTVNTGVEVSIDPASAIVPPGDDTEYSVVVHNLGNTQEEYNLTLHGLDSTWYSLQTPSIVLDPDESGAITLKVFPPNTAAIQTYGFIVVAASQTDLAVFDKADADAIVATAHDLNLEEIPPATQLMIGEPKYTDPVSSKIYVTSATMFTLTAEDNPDGSGVASTFYHIRNGTHDTGRLEYSEPFCLTGLADGQYSIVYYSKDNLANKEMAKSEPVVLDNTPPAIVNIAANPNPVSANVPVTLTATLDGSGTDGSRIVSAECSVDGGDWMPMNAIDGQFDEATEEVTAAINPFNVPDVLYVAVRSTDAVGNTGPPVSILLAVYDPTAGFVSGGGWINSPPGAYSLDPTLTGKATFGFISKYKKGASIPTGQTEFQFHSGNLNFHSTSYQWLVVAGPKAQYKGSGSINGLTGDYGFMLTAIDGQVNGGGGIDKFRIKIWDKATGIIIYDNQIGDSDTANPMTAIAGGSIVIHAK